jgi:hypothetical protein
VAIDLDERLGDPGAEACERLSRAVLEGPHGGEPWDLSEPLPPRTRRHPLLWALLLTAIIVGAFIGVIFLFSHLAGASPAGACGGG